MPRLHSLFSSSKGNSSCVQTEHGAFLIDASPSLRAIEKALRERDIFFEDISGVIITHEHSDHIGALAQICRRKAVPVWAPEKSITYLRQSGVLMPDTQVTPIRSGETFHLCGAEITPFKTPHDAIQSFGFLINCGQDATLGYATDMGFASEEVVNALSGARTVLVESNYDENMLMCGRYERFLKMRIMSERGHLSNFDCGCLITRLLKNGTTNFILGHLSEENNTPELCLKEATYALCEAGAAVGSDCLLSVTQRGGLKEPVFF